MEAITSMRDDCMPTLIISSSTPIIGLYWKMLVYCKSGMLETLHPILANCTTITSKDMGLVLCCFAHHCTLQFEDVKSFIPR